MIVGETMSGKTTCYETLASAMSSLAQEGTSNIKKVEYSVINPKSVTIDQLFGYSDSITKEWNEGIFAHKFKKYSNSKHDNRKWIIMNGPVDAMWIENMNTVLDDNKKLCLSSGDTIIMSEDLTMMFEVADLEQASLATVSRCGMVYMEPTNLGWWPLFKTWSSELHEVHALGL